jgi:hypothetical protein
MKIYYKPYVKFTDIPLEEPNNPMLLRDLSEKSIDSLVMDLYYNLKYTAILQLLTPEQRFVLNCHASYLFLPRYNFLTKMKQEIKQIAKQEIEPGMFKNEDIL